MRLRGLNEQWLDWGCHQSTLSLGGGVGEFGRGYTACVFGDQYEFGLSVRAWMGLQGEGQFTLKTGSL